MKSLGFIELPSVTATIEALDMCKTAEVEFVTWEKSWVTGWSRSLYREMYLRSRRLLKLQWKSNEKTLCTFCNSQSTWRDLEISKKVRRGFRKQRIRKNKRFQNGWWAKCRDKKSTKSGTAKSKTTANKPNTSKQETISNDAMITKVRCSRKREQGGKRMAQEALGMKQEDL